MLLRYLSEGAWKWNITMELAMPFDLKKYSRLCGGWGCGNPPSFRGKYVALSQSAL